MKSHCLCSINDLTFTKVKPVSKQYCTDGRRQMLGGMHPPQDRHHCHRKVDGFVKQIGHYHDHPVSIRWVLVLVEGGQTHLILSAIALTPSFHLVRFAASYSPNPILFKISSTCSSISALAFLDFAAHSLQASMPSLERYHHLS